MAGYDNIRNKILETLLQRPVGTEIQPENHQDFALSLLDYIRSVELISGSTLVGIAYQDTVPVQSDDANEVYIAGVAQERTVVFQNFRDVNGDPLIVTTEEMEAKLVILIWNRQYWSKQEISANIVSQAENAYFFYNLTIRKQYGSVSAMNIDKISPIGNDGRSIKQGEIVSVRNPYNSSEDAVYSYELDADGNPSWVLQMKLSALATRTIDGGSASVRLDTIQNKRDTKANWKINNPVLAEGEIGLVLDDKNSYKVGDGVTKWNDLPLRGYNGNIVNEFGDSYNSVMSQGGITDILKYFFVNNNKIEVGDDLDTLDDYKQPGFYVIVDSDNIPMYYMIVNYDSGPHTINQWVFGNLIINNGSIGLSHIDGSFSIVCRTYSLRDMKGGGDFIELKKSSWTKWRYFQSFFLYDKDGNIGNEEKTLGKNAIENKINVFKGDITQYVNNLKDELRDRIDNVDSDYDYLLLEYQKLIEWVGKLEVGAIEIKDGSIIEKQLNSSIKQQLIPFVHFENLDFDEDTINNILSRDFSDKGCVMRVGLSGSSSTVIGILQMFASPDNYYKFTQILTTKAVISDGSVVGYSDAQVHVYQRQFMNDRKLWDSWTLSPAETVASSSIKAANLAANSVTTTKIKDGAVTEEKLSDALKGKLGDYLPLEGGALSGDLSTLGNIYAAEGEVHATKFVLDEYGSIGTSDQILLGDGSTASLKDLSSKLSATPITEDEINSICV